MRVFLAIELPKGLKKKIFTFSQEIAKDYDIKLVEEKNLHLTLLFLGKISEEQKRRIKEGLGGLGEARKIVLKLGKVEIFPDKKFPRGVWIKVEGEKEKLFALYKKIIDLLLKAGIRLEKKQMRFSPHITLGRIRKGKKLEGLEKSEGLEEQEFNVEKVTFFQSQLSSQGPEYIKIGEFEVK